MSKLSVYLPSAQSVATRLRWLIAMFVGCLLLFSIAHGRVNETLLASAASHKLEGSLEVALQARSGAAFPQSLSFEQVKGPVSVGFTSDVVWVRFTLRREGEQSPPRWWLASSNPLLSDTRLFGLPPVSRTVCLAH